MKKEAQSQITEKVFEILGEGGGISIIREKNGLVEKFIYHHNEFDPTDEGLSVHKNDEYNNFEEPFQLINDKYRWYLLHIETLHYDYRNHIIEKLIEKLNGKSFSQDYFTDKKVRLENYLKIKLNYGPNQNTKGFTWSYCEIE